ncbi:PAS domain S-box protein [Marinibactrum halimedae]|uniref:PAS domain-containing protein n=1 Tax=Marinibactrum halimedae TaxID=1444977 RepID=A0AA37TCI9_9GAMM|nr:PAS domain S-box protein [Marinibactrum halimedae]MCD9460810.1 PAS domain S-box protein [Marinibactrum halimedae]GLS26727.1 hypothetical protein GCM10007877_24440 [Marinibactrum halimedae]
MFGFPSQRENLKEVLDQSIDAIVSIDGNNNVTYFNDAAVKLWGFNREEVIGRNVKMLVPKEIQGNLYKFVFLAR